MNRLGEKFEGNMRGFISENAKQVWKYELGDESYNEMQFKVYEKNDFSAPFASGSAAYNIMIVSHLLHSLSF